MKYNRKEFKIGYIYKIQNKVNGKVYIGQTLYPDSRPFQHLKNPESTNQRFRSSIIHHGVENFQVTILCVCHSKEDLDWAEIFYITEWYDSTHYSRGYNLRTELQGNHFTHSMTDVEYLKHCDAMKIVHRNPIVIKKKIESLSKLKATENWKQQRKEYFQQPHIKLKISNYIKESRKDPQVKKNLSDGQKKSYSENPNRRIEASIRQAGQWDNLLEETKNKIRLKGKETLTKQNLDPEFRKKNIESIRKNRKEESWKIKHKASHNTESYKKKVRETQIHPLRKFIEEHWFVIKEKYPDGFNVYEFMNRFCLDYRNDSLRQATWTGFATLIANQILVDNGYYSISARGRCKKYLWNL